jgi:hypothetical protein
MDSSMGSAEAAFQTTAPRYPHEEWEKQRTTIERLYVTEDRPLREVIQVLKQDHNFAAR